ncbi:MAG: solute carrier family 26 protein [Natronospirillum sp.]|uniref:SulP family inorganic anion transporter n=1 Tax=Natronospirillum sp. TaxID=2812955 RepID=UPI0025E005C3|nr:solute carrier family 26 protein [Natronospirillum sp.]MCH8550358.1 solute carrier family 26 protein [Natronospirillum sp.]
MSTSDLLQRLRHWMPVFQWLPGYQKNYLRGDVLAGVTVAMMLIPQAMSYALLAGLPPYVGLYASVVPLLLYAVFGTSRELAVGPTALQALLVASGLAVLADGSASQYLALAVMLALMVGIIELLMGLARLGYLANFLSQPVISGFTSAAALIIGFSQLQHLIGVDLPRTDNLLALIWMTLQQWQALNPVALLIGAGSIGLLVVLRWLNPLIPGPLLGVAVATLVVWLLRLDSQAGVDIVGVVPSGLPTPAFPVVEWSLVVDLVPIALTIALIGLVESIAVARRIANEHGYDVSPDRELVALGVANMGAALSQAMPVTGSFSRSAVNTRAGARTGLAGIITAGMIAAVLLAGTSLLHFIPTAALAAVIMVAVAGLLDFRIVGRLWRVRRDDLVMWAIAFGGTLLLGVQTGILLAIVASLLWFVVRTTRPHYAVMGRLPDSAAYRNIDRYPEVVTYPGVLIVRFDAQFYFGNVAFLRDTLRRLEVEQATPVRAVVLDAAAVNQLDYSADVMLHELLRDYRSRGIGLFLANVKGPVRDVMVRSGFVAALGEQRFFISTEDAVQAAREWAEGTTA